jgi:hypothetical protein
MENTNENTAPDLHEIHAQKRHEKAVAEAHALREEAQVRVVNLRLAVGMLNRMLEQAETLESFADSGLRLAKELRYEEAQINVDVMRPHLDAHLRAVRQVGLGLSEIR